MARPRARHKRASARYGEGQAPVDVDARSAGRTTGRRSLRVTVTALAALITLASVPVAVAGASSRETSTTTELATTSFIAAGDAFVRSALPEVNYGSETDLVVDSSPHPGRGSGETNTYLRFEIEGVAGPIEGASLSLYVTNGGRDGFDLHSVQDASWGEQTITYANAPAPAAPIGSTGPVAAGQWVTVDVTALVTGNGAVSFALTTSSSSSIEMASRENGPSLAPRLDVATAAAPVAPVNTALPSVQGLAVAGELLTADPGVWSGTEPLSFAYQWRRCDAGGGSCVDLDGAVGSSYRLLAADVGATVRVAVTASNSAGSATAVSDPSAAVAAAPAGPVNTVAPSVVGSPVVGSSVSADAGVWTGTEPLSFAYQWRRCDAGGGSCVEIAGATGQEYLVAAADLGATLRVAVTASNSAGSATAVSEPTGLVAPPPAADPTIAAAGDIASAGSPSAAQWATSDLLVGGDYTAVLTLGDNQYEDGALTDFLSSYDPTWGRVKAKTYPSPGNHEYHTPGAVGYFTYFGAIAAGGYYSFDLGAWHLISLDSEIDHSDGSPQETWLENDLAAHRNTCTLAYWHKPRFSSGPHGNDSSLDAFWQDLYAAGVDVVLNGHDHDYERFAAQTPSAVANVRGVREFVVGTGGLSHYSLTSLQPNSEVFDGDTFGVLALTLHATSYEWRFIPASGFGTFTDAGSGTCS